MVAPPITPPSPGEFDLPPEVGAALRPAWAGSEPLPDIVLTEQEFARVLALIETPPAPSARLRRLLGRGSAVAVRDHDD